MAAPLWTSEDIALATGGAVSAPFTITGTVSIDSRSLKAGDLFVALQDQRDGHEFASAAFAAGAAGALVSRDVSGGPFVRAGDTLDALINLGIAARLRSGAVRVAVTGSVGKTSVKDMLAQMFRAFGPSHASAKSFNNHWGVPLTLARMPEATERAVFEIGMSTPGEIAPRSQMVRPHIGIVTRIAPAHLEGLGSTANVAREKGDIFAGLEAGGTIILPQDDEYIDLLTNRARAHCPTGNIETFGTDATATARVLDYSTDGRHSQIALDIVGRKTKVSIEAVGEHWALNCAAALLAASQTGRSVADCAEALSGYAPPAGRGTAEVLRLPEGGDFLLIDDAYNANPASMRAALKAAGARRDAGAGKRCLVALGEMLEIGETSLREHAGLAEPLAAIHPAAIFLCGERMKDLAEAIPPHLQCLWAPTADELWNGVMSALRPGDLLLVKGSNASGMGRLADRLRQWSRSAQGAATPSEVR